MPTIAESRYTQIMSRTYSPRNLAIVQDALNAKGCECEVGAMTHIYNDWLVLNRQVMKGQKALCKVMTFVPDKVDPSKKYPRGSAIFCLCQTEEME